ncbi:hypothetical protein ACIQV3_22530 [Streptomyces sp. NPDC099050]|uniref:hypothetical protein n=1 Tax=Streptomyces sp. NPDC099050 TaxID=3366100 RepID=UPI0037F31C6C
MTPDQLRAAIAADCPHRLPDYDGHLAGRQPTTAFLRLWRIEHAISSRPRLEARIDRLYRRAQKTRSVWRSQRLIAKASRIRHQITRGLK